jgi:hypothetical protein
MSVKILFLIVKLLGERGLFEEAPKPIFKQSHMPSHHTPMVKVNKGRSLTYKEPLRTLHWRCPKCTYVG